MHLHACTGAHVQTHAGSQSGPGDCLLMLGITHGPGRLPGSLARMGVVPMLGGAVGETHGSRELFSELVGFPRRLQ